MLEMNQILMLNDGTVVNGHIIDNGDGLIIFVYLDNMSLAEGFYLFSVKGKTSVITENSYGIERVYKGYTHLSSISDEYGNCNIVMKKE